MNLDRDLTPSQKLTQNDHKLKGKMQKYKLLKDNGGENLDDLGYRDDFLYVTLRAWSMKTIIDKLDFIKIKTLLWKRLCQENEKKSHRLGVNICKRHIWKRTITQNIQRTHLFIYLLLFKYGCFHFPPTTLPRLTDPHLPPSILPLFGFSMGPLYMSLDNPSPSFPHKIQQEENKQFNLKIGQSQYVRQRCHTHFHQGPHQPRSCLQRAKCNFKTV